MAEILVLVGGAILPAPCQPILDLARISQVRFRVEHAQEAVARTLARNGSPPCAGGGPILRGRPGSARSWARATDSDPLPQCHGIAGGVEFGML